MRKHVLAVMMLMLTAPGTPARAEAHVTIGSGSQYYSRPALGRPFGTEPQRYHLLVLQDELPLAPGTRLAGLAFDGAVFARSEITFGNVEIRLWHTDADSLQASFAANLAGHSPQSVLRLPELVMDNFERDWVPLRFDQAFVYDGRSNVVIEFRHTGGNGTFRTTRWARAAGRVLDSAGLPASGPEAEDGILRDYINAMRLLVAEDSLLP